LPEVPSKIQKLDELLVNNIEVIEHSFDSDGFAIFTNPRPNREEGGFEYKKTIVETILTVISDVPNAKEVGP